MISPWELDRDALCDLITDIDDGLPRYRLDQIWHGLYELGIPPAELTELPKALRAELGKRMMPLLSSVQRQSSSDGRTVKQLWEAADGAQVESVLMHYTNRSTVCISSQAGCAMACTFCSTGQGGYLRNLTVGEIMEQVVNALVEAAPRRLSNVVFMGMGEPFANYDRVMEATRRIIDDLGIGARKITVSTVGLVPQMLRFADEGLQVGLALSLHAANNELRSSLVPLNRRHPIADLVAASQLFRERTGRRVSFEWAMIDGVNDRASDVVELADVAKAARAHVNLIPLNPTPGYPTAGSPPQHVEWFRKQLEHSGVTATIRANRGTDIDAACGQLRVEYNTPGQRQPTPVTLGTQSESLG